MNQIPNIEEECNCTNFNKDIIDTSECELHQGNIHNTREVEEWEKQAAKIATEAYKFSNNYAQFSGYIYGVMKGLSQTLHQELQKARQDWLREVKEKVKEIAMTTAERKQALNELIDYLDRYHSELDQPTV